MQVHDPGKRIKTVVDSEDRAGAFAWRTLRLGRRLADRVDDDHKYWT
mgnify:CR=1 FL=1